MNLPGQAGGDSLAERELSYRAAVAAYDAALAARQVVENQWRQALEAVTAARRAGDQAALDRASNAFIEQATELERLDIRVRSTQDSLEVARESLLEALDRRMGELVEEADTVTTDVRRMQILSLARDLQNQYRELVSAGADALTPTPVLYPGILAYDPRDTPDLIRQKAQLVERRIDAVQTQRDEALARIEGIERLIRLRRQQDNFSAPLDRFGDVQVPVVSGGGSQGQGETGVPDSAGARAPTLEEQLEAWRLQEEQLGFLLTQLRENLRRFRERIGVDRPSVRGGDR